MTTPAKPVADDDKAAAVAKMAEILTGWGVPPELVQKGAEAAVNEAIKRRGGS